ncbi:hypothetical protein ACHWQZ_G000662 [Mnemiopsis leidyi]
MAEATDESAIKIDTLDVEDKLKWCKEILEYGRERFGQLEKSESLTEFINELANQKIISGFNKMSLEKLKVQSEVVEELHRILPSKGWDNFKKAREILYTKFPNFKEEGIWDEDKVDDLPVLSIKYSAANEDLSATGVEHDGAAATSTNDIADVDGMFSSSSRAPAQPTKSEPVKSRSDFSALPSYSMTNRRHKGICLIINNELYDRARAANKDFKDRRGSSKDADSIKELFSKLGFYVEYQKNLTKSKMDKLVDMMVSFQGLNTYSCFVAVFLSHGENECLNCVDGQDKKIDDIINAFKGDNCPALRGIPKWFIIQACRGKDFNYEVNIQHDAPGDDGHDVERQSDRPISIPACADFYISYATAPGYFSYRNTRTGSWFIQCLVEILAKYHWWEDVNTMMTRVNRKVALGFHHKIDGEYVRQMPYHVNMLTGSLFLHSSYTA